VDLETEDLGVEPLGLVLVIDIDADESDPHRPCPFSLVVASLAILAGRDVAAVAPAGFMTSSSLLPIRAIAAGC
jgi:hypothetical protein